MLKELSNTLKIQIIAAVLSSGVLGSIITGYYSSKTSVEELANQKIELVLDRFSEDNERLRGKIQELSNEVKELNLKIKQLESDCGKYNKDGEY